MSADKRAHLFFVINTYRNITALFWVSNLSFLFFPFLFIHLQLILKKICSRYLISDPWNPEPNLCFVVRP